MMNRWFVPFGLLVLAGWFGLNWSDYFGINPAPISGPIVVGATPSNDSCPGCVISTRDNPKVEIDGSLSSSPGPDPSEPILAEYTARNASGVAFKNVKFDLYVKGDDAKGAMSMNELRPLPRSIGSWQGNVGIPSVTVPFDIDGIELGYAKSEVKFHHENGTGGSTLQMASPLSAELAQNVLLVPIQSFRIIPASSTSSYYRVTNNKTEYIKELFDFRPPLDTFRGMHPGVPNSFIQQTFVGNTLANWKKPDDIWAQCNIQFRMIGCGNEGFDCPDLVVAEDKYVSALSCRIGSIGDHPEVRENFNSVNSLRGARSDVPKIIFMDSVSNLNSGCESIGATRIGAAAVAYQGLYAEFLVAHELGHLLGVDDDFKCNRDAEHLMCSDDRSQTSRIRPQDCVKARQTAAGMVKRMWDVEIAP
jgi:hypothetical protein